MTAVRERLRDAAETAIDLDQRLEEVIAVPVSKIRGDNKRGRIDHSQPPWNARVAHLIMELHSGARVIEAEYRTVLNMRWQYRGDKDSNTKLALLAVLNLAEAAEDSFIAEHVRWLNSWCARALIVLGDRDLPKHLPRDVGQPEPRCPYCARLTLRFWAIQGEVRCVNPACRDGDDRRPVARMEYSPVVQDWILAWRDGTTGMGMPVSANERIVS